ncbi:hypothetical protein WA1_03215 [Scytonema hofmannii PCC 7110]|uniref:Uncharacterized protein n=1 Tax=Scytonema hofmannii PCC 7110 TaxID=128403 RepID=A0A139XHJ0_9CYAN|nr:hypothetical protein [Scytonema hofmannii]KYC44160.1 hypothetical protein WA1_03215 [Scytonema hofmannii PCC 7110]
MKYAASIRYGGQLFAAIECNYEDYLLLGLHCPVCSEPVVLRAAHNRIVHNKEVKVASSFIHRAVKNPILVTGCELRVSRYSIAEIETRARSARNQRLKLLQQWFWQILWAKNPLLPGGKVARELFFYIERFKSNVLNNLDRSCHRQLIYQTCQQLFSERKQIEDYLELFLANLRGEKGRIIKHSTDLLIAANKNQQLKFLRTKIDQRMHKLIVKEVADFLRSRKMELLFEKIFWYVLYLLDANKQWQPQIFAESNIIRLHSQSPNEMISSRIIIEICQLIVYTDWASGFAELSATRTVTEMKQKSNLSIVYLK